MYLPEPASLPGECSRRQKRIHARVTVTVNTAKTPHLWRAQTTNGPLLIFSVSQVISLGLIKWGLYDYPQHCSVFKQRKGAHSTLLLDTFSLATVPGLIVNPGPWLETRADLSHSHQGMGIRPPMSPRKCPSLLHPMKTHKSTPSLAEPLKGKLHSQLGSYPFAHLVTPSPSSCPSLPEIVHVCSSRWGSSGDYQRTLVIAPQPPHLAGPGINWGSWVTVSSKGGKIEAQEAKWPLKK